MVRFSFAALFFVSVTIATTGCSQKEEPVSSPSLSSVSPPQTSESQQGNLIPSEPVASPTFAKENAEASTDLTSTIKPDTATSPEPPSVKSFVNLDPADWILQPLLPTENGKPKKINGAYEGPCGEVVQNPDGLQVTTSENPTMYQLKFKKEFSNDFEIVMEIINLRPNAQSISVGVKTYSETPFMDDLPKGFGVSNTSNVRIRATKNRYAVSINDDFTHTYENTEKLPFEISLVAWAKCSFVVSKFEYKENLPTDEKLAASNTGIVQHSSEKETKDARSSVGQTAGGPPPFGPGGPPPFGPGGFPPFGPGGPPPFGPGGPAAFGPGGPMGGGHPDVAGPHGPIGSNPAAELLQSHQLPQPSQSQPLKTVGDWYVPQQNESDDEQLSQNLQLDASDNAITLNTTPGAIPFWLLRKLESHESFSFECRVILPSLLTLQQQGRDPTSMLAVKLFPAIQSDDSTNSPTNESFVSCPALPSPLPNLQREVVIKVTRNGERLLLTIDKTSLEADVSPYEPVALGLYVRGVISFSIEEQIAESNHLSSIAQTSVIEKLKSNRSEIVVRQAMSLKPVTSMSLSEDGKLLFLCHETENLVSVWDVCAGKVSHTIETPKPRSILCRGNYAFVTHTQADKLTLLSRSDNWTEIDNLVVPNNIILHVSAPVHENFKDEILVTCRGASEEKNTPQYGNYLLNYHNGQLTQVGSYSFATFDASGTKVLVQEKTNLGTTRVAISDTEDLDGKGNLPTVDLSSEIAASQHFYAIPQSDCWLSNQFIIRANANAPLYQNYFAILVPDLAQNLIYAVSPNTVDVFELTNEVTAVSSHPLRFETLSPSVAETRLIKNRAGAEDLLLNRPLAYTHDDKLYLFLLDPEAGELFQAVVPAFKAQSTSQEKEKDLLLTKAPATAQEGETPDDSQGKSLADVISAAEASVVRIETKGKDGDGIGSGFVVDDKGTLITNCHVLAGATSARAFFSDGKSCEIIGTTLVDQPKDIVVAKIDLVDRPKIELASTLPRKGDEVIALGTPHGLDFSATRGIVSAIRQAKELPSDNGTPREGVWIQIDAPLSPGNSGGPLINRSGKVVAMSTLASQGSAQNLNFGISAEDVAKAIAKATGLPTRTLRNSTASIKYQSPARGGSSPSAPDSEAVSNIPPEPLQRYIEDCKKNFTKYVKELRDEIRELGSVIKEMERGTVPLPPNTDSKAMVAKLTTPQNQVIWFFRTAELKQAIIEHTEERLENLTSVRSKLKNNRDPDSLKYLAINYGPKLDPRKNHEIGFLRDAIVIRAFNDHEVAVDVDGIPYLIWMISTAGLAEGEPILPCAVYVDGTVTMNIPQHGSRAVTVLRQVSETQFAQTIEKILQKPRPNNTDSDEPKSDMDSFRTWADATGKYKIEAELISNEGGIVKLKRRDGTIASLPLEKLSQEDRDYLESLP